MNRRNTLLALAALGAWPYAANAQQARKLPVIGYLYPGFPPPATNPSLTALREGLRELGYVDGETIRIESRWANGKPGTLPGFAQELVKLNVDALVAVGPPSVMAAKGATSVLPILALDLETDPIASGLVSNLARPNGNITGLFLDLPSMAGKWLQLIREIVPGLQRIAVLWDANTGPYQTRPLEAAAKAIGIALQILEFRASAEIESALDAGLKKRPQAYIQLGSPQINQGAPRIAEFLAKNRLPGISPFRSFPDSGGLMSYGPNLPILYRRMAPFISRILKGAKPGELSVEQPTHYELIVNQKTASALGFKIQQSMLQRADEVIG
jgi:putative ABC transport system substrate-binding protein